MQGELNVRTLTPADVDAAAVALARSFESDDTFFQWMFGEDPFRALVRSFRSQLRVIYVPQGLARTVDGLAGAALWSAPGRGVSPTLWQSLRMTPAHLRWLPPHRMVRALRAFSVMDSHHPDETHIHLALLGVDPNSQRSGVGTALVNEGLRRADASGLPVYLDTTNPDNVPYYERFGFEVMCEFDIPFGGPHAWGMVRRARFAMPA